MRKKLTCFFIAALAVSGSAMSDTVIVRTLYQSMFGNRAQVIDGKVIRIADGDTVTLLDSGKQQYRIRLLGIDAPEKAQAYGTRSRQNLSDLVFNKDVQADCIGQDRYNRRLCKILVNGVDVNLEQVKAGFAWHYKRYQNSQTSSDRKAYAKAEQDAKNARRGLWNDPSPVAPWSFRRRQ